MPASPGKKIKRLGGARVALEKRFASTRAARYAHAMQPAVLVPCRACHAQVSLDAEVCPRCGQRMRPKPPLALIVLLFVGTSLVLSFLYGWRPF